MTRPTCYFIWMSSRRAPGIEDSAILPPHSLAVAAFSTIVEWYDFTLYLYFATVLARVFYGGGSGSLIMTLGGFAIAYLMRPLGAVFFSHIGDRHGRRRMMLLSVALMTAAMLATALPSDESGGSARPRAGCSFSCVASWVFR